MELPGTGNADIIDALLRREEAAARIMARYIASTAAAEFQQFMRAELGRSQEEDFAVLSCAMMIAAGTVSSVFTHILDRPGWDEAAAIAVDTHRRLLAEAIAEYRKEAE